MNEKKNSDSACKNENAGGNGLVESEKISEYIPESDISLGKFKNVNELLKAYNCLEAEFTKRSQRLKELERELVERTEQSEVKPKDGEQTQGDAENTDIYNAENAVVLGESANSVADGYDDGRIANEVCEFLNEHPEASAYAEQIAEMTSRRGDLSKGFLQKAYVAVLNEAVKAERERVTEDFILQKALQSSSVKEKIIRDYLSAISSQKGAKLISNAGEIAVIPPSKPKSISQAGEMAISIFKG